jgi:uncharacterized membrane protein
MWHAGTVGLAAYAASLVEFVEALTVVLAVGAVRGWLGAIGGAVAALGVLLGLVAVLGPALTLIPLRAVHLVVGWLLLVFGLRWLRRAVLRAAGRIPLHDEAAVYARETGRFRVAGGVGRGVDSVAVSAAFKVTFVEGVEVVFIVIATGAGGFLWSAGLGALAALVVVVLLGVALHRPLTRVPENTLKFGVGVLVSAFGTFWVGESTGYAPFSEDILLIALILVYTFGALAAASLFRIRTVVR